MEPKFVRKHILSKHTEKVEAIKQDAAHFNNYIADPARPRRTPRPVHPPMIRRLLEAETEVDAVLMEQLQMTEEDCVEALNLRVCMG